MYTVSTNNEIKIKKLHDLHFPVSVIFAYSLDLNGFSHDLYRYRKKWYVRLVIPYQNLI